MNHLRLGAAGPSDIGDQYICFKDYRSENNKLMSDLLDMAQANGCYVTMNMGGGGEEVSTDFGVGPIKVVHTEAFNNYVQYCADFINAYGTHEAIAMFDLFNEPNNFDGQGRSPWWVAQYGLELVYLEPPHEDIQAGAWEAAYMIWKNALITEVKAKVTLNPRPLITIGDTRPFINYWNDAATVAAAVARMLRWVENYDVMIGHGYGAAEDDYLVHWNLRNAVTANMPSYEEEFGYGPQPYVPPYYSYWPWRDQMFQLHGISSCSMVLWEWPDGTGSGVPQAAYPGYPIPQSVMDSIPPMPGGVVSRKHSPTASAYGSPHFY
jgi:hypothetical protein